MRFQTEQLQCKQSNFMPGYKINTRVQKHHSRFVFDVINRPRAHNFILFEILIGGEEEREGGHGGRTQSRSQREGSTGMIKLDHFTS
jgi:hypothetical protein